MTALRVQASAYPLCGKRCSGNARRASAAQVRADAPRAWTLGVEYHVIVNPTMMKYIQDLQERLPDIELNHATSVDESLREKLCLCA
jgi:hypothetical protein